MVVKRKKRKRKSYIKCGLPLCPTMYQPVFGKLDDGSEGFVLADHTGEIISIEEMKEIAERLLETIPYLSNEMIKIQNKKTLLQNSPEMFPQIYGENDPMWIEHLEHQEMMREMTKDKKTKKLDIGYIYVIKAEGQSIYKIGKSKSVPNRISQLDKQYPFEIEIYTYFKSEEVSNIETELHNLFKNKRQKGEWFALNKQDLRTIDSIKTEKGIAYD